MTRPFLLLLCLLQVVHAQLTRSVISGLVSDQSGAALANVSVEAIESHTQARRTTITNESGTYRLGALEPGTWTVQFSRQGFQDTVVEKVVVEATHDRVVDITLSLSEKKTAVLVEANRIDLDRSSASVDRTLGSDFMEKIPLTGTRDISYLMALGPTAVRIPATPEFNYVASGQRPGRTEFLLDGLDNRAQSFDFAFWRAIPEEIGEVQIKTNAYSAEFGRSAGIVMSAVTRSASNALHGSVWDYYSGSWAAAQLLADKAAGIPKPRWSEHHAGANVGLPLHRDKTFLFLLFEGNPSSMGLSSAQSLPIVIPTAAGLSTLPQVPLGTGQSMASREAVLASLTFLSAAYPLIRRYDGLFLRPIHGQSVEFGVARVPFPNNSNVSQGMLRVDHQLTSRDALTFRLLELHASEDIGQSGRAGFTNKGFGTIFGTGDVFGGPAGTVTGTHLFGPAAINEARFGWSANTMDARPYHQDTFALISQSFGIGSIPVAPFYNPTRNLEWQDVLTFQRGRYAVKVGADLLHVNNEIRSSNFSRGFWSFNSFEDFLDNNAAVLLYNIRPAVSVDSALQQAYFVQLDYRARRNVTLNVGLRYQLSGVPLAKYGTNDPTLREAGIPAPAHRDTNDLAPRFGFAWSAGRNVVVRGGFGVVYEQTLQPFVGSFRLATYPDSISLAMVPPFTSGLYPAVPEGGPGIPPLLPFAYNFSNPSPDVVNPTTHIYSLSVQTRVANAGVIEAGYLGNRAYHLWRTTETNPRVSVQGQGLQRLNPDWASRALLETAGRSNYNAAFIRADSRWRRLLFGASYTFSAALDDGEGPPQDVRNFRREYGRSDIDRPHRASAYYLFDLAPGFSGRSASLRALVQHWQIAGYSEWQSGQPFTITTGIDTNGDTVVNPLWNVHPDRPDYNPSGVLRLDPVTHDWRSFRSPTDGAGVFVTPVSGGLPLPNSAPAGGNLGRNTFRGPGYANTNVSLLKELHTGERLVIEFRASWTNALNHRNFGPPVAVISRLDFGSNQSSPDSRRTTLGLRIRF